MPAISVAEGEQANVHTLTSGQGSQCNRWRVVESFFRSGYENQRTMNAIRCQGPLSQGLSSERGC